MNKEWETEPNRVEFEHLGFPCLIKRHYSMGFLCGYVGVPPSHPWHGKGYPSVEAEVHGGLTYSAECDGDPVDGICHKPKEGQTDDTWWLGFDCGHGYDFIPYAISEYANPMWALGQMVAPAFEQPLQENVPKEEYRNIEYVRMQCEKLAAQAQAVRDSEILARTS